MPRKRRDEEVVIGFLKQFARDKDCPWQWRVYCVYALAVHTKMLPGAVFPPGTGRYRDQGTLQKAVASEASPEEPQTEPVSDSDFLSQLKRGGDDGSSRVSETISTKTKSERVEKSANS